MEKEKSSQGKWNERLFIQLIVTFQAAAMQQMGKLKNPLTDKIEKNMEQASLSIDMLDMIKEKTRGNLSKDEEKLLDFTLSELKMNYVEEMRKAEEGKKEKEKAREEKKPDEGPGKTRDN
ncbi:MAG: DUF1844 domain-containing protein [Fidelibacterota bacterium]